MSGQAARLMAGNRRARPERAPLGRLGERPQGVGALALAVDQPTGALLEVDMILSQLGG